MTFPRRALLAAPAVLALPRFAIAQADQRPAITIAVQKVVNSNVLDVLRSSRMWASASSSPRCGRG
jgi:peptide/nickel transport system substrate-binding protein